MVPQDHGFRSDPEKNKLDNVLKGAVWYLTYQRLWTSQQPFKSVVVERFKLLCGLESDFDASKKVSETKFSKAPGSSFTIQGCSGGQLDAVMSLTGIFGLCFDPSIVLLDEPGQNLGAEERSALQAVIAEARKERAQVLVITHHVEMLERSALPKGVVHVHFTSTFTRSGRKDASKGTGARATIEAKFAPKDLDHDLSRKFQDSDFLELYFARRAILVEGVTDVAILDALFLSIRNNRQKAALYFPDVDFGQFLGVPAKIVSCRGNFIETVQSFCTMFGIDFVKIRDVDVFFTHEDHSLHSANGDDEDEHVSKTSNSSGGILKPNIGSSMKKLGGSFASVTFKTRWRRHDEADVKLRLNLSPLPPTSHSGSTYALIALLRWLDTQLGLPMGSFETVTWSNLFISEKVDATFCKCVGESWAKAPAENWFTKPKEDQDPISNELCNSIKVCKQFSSFLDSLCHHWGEFCVTGQKAAPSSECNCGEFGVWRCVEFDRFLQDLDDHVRHWAVQSFDTLVFDKTKANQALQAELQALTLGSTKKATTDALSAFFKSNSHNVLECFNCSDADLGNLLKKMCKPESLANRLFSSFETKLAAGKTTLKDCVIDFLSTVCLNEFKNTLHSSDEIFNSIREKIGNMLLTKIAELTKVNPHLRLMLWLSVLWFQRSNRKAIPLATFVNVTLSKSPFCSEFCQLWENLSNTQTVKAFFIRLRDTDLEHTFAFLHEVFNSLDRNSFFWPLQTADIEGILWDKSPLFSELTCRRNFNSAVAELRTIDNPSCEDLCLAYLRIKTALTGVSRSLQQREHGWQSLLEIDPIFASHAQEESLTAAISVAPLSGDIKKEFQKLVKECFQTARSIKDSINKYLAIKCEKYQATFYNLCTAWREERRLIDLALEVQSSKSFLWDDTFSKAMGFFSVFFDPQLPQIESQTSKVSETTRATKTNNAGASTMSTVPAPAPAPVVVAPAHSTHEIPRNHSAHVGIYYLLKELSALKWGLEFKKTKQ